MESESVAVLLDIAENAYKRWSLALQWTLKLEKSLVDWRSTGRAAAAEYYHAAELLEARGLKMRGADELWELRKTQPDAWIVAEDLREKVGELGAKAPIVKNAADAPHVSDN